MDVLLRTLTRRNGSPSRGSRRSRRDEPASNTRQFEVVLEMLARGLVEYAVRKYTPSTHGNRDRSRHDNRLRTRGAGDEEERNRGGVPNMDMDLLEHLGKTILSKAIEKFGGGDTQGDREGDRGRGAGLERHVSTRDRSREREYPRNRGEDDVEGRGRRRANRSRGGRQRSPSSPGGEWRRRHTDYEPLKIELEALSDAIISLNERQPDHPDCEFYETFVERSGKVQEGIGAVMVRIREREERRERRRRR
ncbi:hypothetical protein C8035_v007912 [Colletotrichum spinosum]|uniref:Uncharacterized protein n=1 Tax=Colletotrichum spinosum TaxID=1347390 RepID=A0A4R8QBJ3_9PEZI|nr:hypothetical protein C8035_v007912 [Colletotrichum spinosum]